MIISVHNVLRRFPIFNLHLSLSFHSSSSIIFLHFGVYSIFPAFSQSTLSFGCQLIIYYVHQVGRGRNKLFFYSCFVRYCLRYSSYSSRPPLQIHSSFVSVICLSHSILFNRDIDFLPNIFISFSDFRISYSGLCSFGPQIICTFYSIKYVNMFTTGYVAVLSLTRTGFYRYLLQAICLNQFTCTSNLSLYS